MLCNIHIYNGTFSDVINVQEIYRYVKKLLAKVQIYIHDEFILHFVLKNSQEKASERIQKIAELCAQIKIIEPHIKERTTAPLYGEIEYEKRRLFNTIQQPSGILYNGEKLWALYNHVLAEEERSFASCHIALTNQLFATWDNDNKRYHARTSIYGIPSIVSISGLVEAPARSRSYYLSRYMGHPNEAIDEKFRNEFLTHDDTRMTQIVKGYIAQALFYHLTGDPFCTDPGCRLFNAHWQHELIYAQLDSSYDFCPEHQRVLQCFNNW